MKLKNVKVAAIQFKPVKGDIHNNLYNLKGLIIESASNGAKLIVAPEMATTGYFWNSREEIQNYVEEIPGPTTMTLSKITEKYDIYIVIGLAEKDENDIYYNSSVLIGPNGIIGKYRKVHPFITDLLWGATGDSEIDVFETPIGNIGMAICMDLTVPETVRVLQRKGCDIICSPVNWFGEKLPSNIWITRAIETKCNLIVSNRWGIENDIEFGGNSCVINSKGEVKLIDELKNGIVYSNLIIESKKIKIKKYNIYKNLMLNPYKWNPNDFSRQIDGNIDEIKFKATAVEVDYSRLTDNCNNEIFIIDTVKAQIKEGSKLIVFPENFLGSISKEGLEKIVKKISLICKENSAYVVLSGIEKFNDKVCSKIWIIGSSGIESEYKKIIPRKQEENFLLGEELTIFNSIYGKIGMLFGNEILDMEFPRILALKGVDVIVVVDSNIDVLNRMYKEYDVMWSIPMIRAKENNLYVIYSNYSKPGYLGYSGVFGPDLVENSFDYKIEKNKSGIVDMMLYIGGNSDKFPTSSVKYKPLLHLRNPQFYKTLI